MLDVLLCWMHLITRLQYFEYIQFVCTYFLVTGEHIINVNRCLKLTTLKEQLPPLQDTSRHHGWPITGGQLLRWKEIDIQLVLTWHPLNSPFFNFIVPFYIFTLCSVFINKALQGFLTKLFHLTTKHQNERVFLCDSSP
jgi:hypothetical protein